MYDEFGFDESLSKHRDDEPAGNHVPMRELFPEAGIEYLGGTSDGWEYRSVFAGAKLAYTYEMVKQFLQEEGYGNVPIPPDVDALKLFRRPRRAQLALFAEQGYIHNPIKILFSTDKTQRNTLILCLYNEQAPNHLLRFHGVFRSDLL